MHWEKYLKFISRVLVFLHSFIQTLVWSFWTMNCSYKDPPTYSKLFFSLLPAHDLFFVFALLFYFSYCYPLNLTTCWILKFILYYKNMKNVYSSRHVFRYKIIHYQGKNVFLPKWLKYPWSHSGKTSWWIERRKIWILTIIFLDFP